MAIERLEFGGLLIIIIIIIILLYERTVVVEKGATMWALGFHTERWREESPPLSALFTDISPNVRFGSVRFRCAREALATGGVARTIRPFPRRQISIAI